MKLLGHPSKSVTIETTEFFSPAPLYHRYPQQTGPQGAFVSLDLETGEVRADWNGEIGNAVPESVWHGVVRRYAIPATIRGACIVPLIETLRPCLERVYEGATVQDDHNYRPVVSLTQDAEDAEEEMRGLVQQLGEDESLSAWDVGDWLANTAPYELLNAGETVEQAAERMTDEALADGVILDGDVEEYIQGRIADE